MRGGSTYFEGGKTIKRSNKNEGSSMSLFSMKVFLAGVRLS